MNRSVLSSLLILMIIGGVGEAVADTDTHVIAIGQVDGATGNLVNSANSIDATSVTSSRLDTGHYRISIEKTGPLFIDNRNDFVVQVTPKGLGSAAIIATATWGTTIGGRLLHINVKTDDVEDIAYSLDDDPLPTDASFYFSVLFIPRTTPRPADTKFLVAVGKTALNGSLVSAAAIDNIQVTSGRARRVRGDYEILLRKTAAFSGASMDDFVVNASVEGADLGDVTVRGEVEQVTDDLVQVRIRTDDSQAAPLVSLAQTEPEDEVVFFSIYRIPAAPDEGRVTSRLLVAMGDVSFTGSNSSGVFDGGIVTSQRVAAGVYQIHVDSAGAFAGGDAAQFVLMLQAKGNPLSPDLSSDIFPNGRISITSDDRMVIDVNTNDLEQGGEEEGVPGDAGAGVGFDGFYFFVFDALQERRPDSRVGARRNPSSHRGNNRYNTNSAGQTIRLVLRRTRMEKFYFSQQNDGNLSDDLLPVGVAPGRRLRARVFRLTGGRENITTAFFSASLPGHNVGPGEFVLYESKVKYRNRNRRPRSTMRIISSSGFGPPFDFNRVILIPR